MEGNSIEEVKNDRIYLKIDCEQLQLNDCISFAQSPSCGAISTFLGTTRDNFDGKVVETLEYESYTSMALNKMEEICNEVY